mgnify:FL=1
MTGEVDAATRRAPVGVNEQLTGQEQRQDAAVKANAWYHPFDWWDLLLLIVPIAIIVLTAW